jgi:hypothetical protein
MCPLLPGSPVFAPEEARAGHVVSTRSSCSRIRQSGLLRLPGTLETSFRPTADFFLCYSSTVAEWSSLSASDRAFCSFFPVAQMPRYALMHVKSDLCLCGPVPACPFCPQLYCLVRPHLRVHRASIVGYTCTFFASRSLCFLVVRRTAESPPCVQEKARSTIFACPRPLTSHVCSSLHCTGVARSSTLSALWSALTCKVVMKESRRLGIWPLFSCAIRFSLWVE